MGGSLNFSNVFGDHAALQMAPAKTIVYGYIGTNATADTTVAVTIASTAGAEAVSYTVNALINAADGTWKAYLKPGAAGGVYAITAGCTHGCTGTASIADVTFGDVWYCAGQSNMALPVQYTYARNASNAKIKRGGCSEQDPAHRLERKHERQSNPLSNQESAREYWCPAWNGGVQR